MSSDKGQMFSTDLLAAVALFALALGVVAAAWDFGKTRMGEAEYVRELERKSYAASGILAETAGEPADWELDPASVNVSGIGLAEHDRVISAGKFASLRRLDPERLRGLLGLGSGRVYVLLRGGDCVIGAAGEAPAASFASTSARPVSYLNRTAFLEVTVWGGGG